MARPRWLARRLKWRHPVRFIYIVDTDKKTGNETPRFLNIACILQIFQKDEDVIIEMTDYTEIRIINTNIQVFMERFV